MTLITNLKQLYEIDDQQWLSETYHEKTFSANPNYLQQEINNIYTKALKQVKVKTNFKVDFPEECPYTLEQLLDENYL